MADLVTSDYQGGDIKKMGLQMQTFNKMQSSATQVGLMCVLFAYTSYWITVLKSWDLLTFVTNVNKYQDNLSGK